MRWLLAIALLLCACDTGDHSGTLGLPTSIPTRSASASGAATPPSTAGALRTTPPPTPSPTSTANGTPTGAPTRTQLPTPTANPNDVTPPFVVSMSATQQTLTVVFSEPMRSRLACGATGAATGPFGTIDNHGTGEATGPYHSTDRALDETLQSATQATIGSDCASVTFVYSTAAAAGTFTVTVSAVQDVSGNVIDPTRNSAQVTIRDEGPPIVFRADAFGDNIYVTYSEPMLQIGEGGGVTMAGNYRLDGNPAPITTITCNDGGCRSVRLWLSPGTIVPGRTYSLRVTNVVDRSGVGLRPDPTTLSVLGRDVQGRTPAP